MVSWNALKAVVLALACAVLAQPSESSSGHIEPRGVAGREANRTFVGYVRLPKEEAEEMKKNPALWRLPVEEKQLGRGIYIPRDGEPWGDVPLRTWFCYINANKVFMNNASKVWVPERETDGRMNWWTGEEGMRRFINETKQQPRDPDMTMRLSLIDVTDYPDPDHVHLVVPEKLAKDPDMDWKIECQEELIRRWKWFPLLTKESRPVDKEFWQKVKLDLKNQ